MIGKKQYTYSILVVICVLSVVSLWVAYAYDRRFRAFTPVYEDGNVLIELQYLAGDLRITYDDDRKLNRTIVVVPDYYDSRIVESVKRFDDGLIITFRNGRAIRVSGGSYLFMPESTP